MIRTRLATRGTGDVQRWAPLGPGGEPQLSLQGLGAPPAAGYGEYGDVVNLSGHRTGEVIRWSRLGPGGDPIMSLQGTQLGRCGAGCGCGPCRMSGIPTTVDEVDWYQLGLGIVLGAGIFYAAKRYGWV